MAGVDEILARYNPGYKPKTERDNLLAAGKRGREKLSAIESDKDSDFTVRNIVKEVWDTVQPALDRFNDRVSLGVYDRAWDLGRDQEQRDKLAQARSEQQGRHPISSGAGDVGGTAVSMFSPYGAGRVIGQAGQGAARAMLPEATHAVDRAIVAGAGGAASGAGYYAADTLGHGGTPTMDEAARAAKLGGAAGAGFSMVGDALTGGWNMLRNPKTLRGRTLATREQAVNSPVTQTEEFNSLPHGKAGYNEAADVAGQRLADLSVRRGEQATADYGRRLDAVSERIGDRSQLMDRTHALLDELEAKNAPNGTPADPGLDKAIKKAREMLTRRTGILDRHGQEIVVPAARLRDVIAAKKSIVGDAKMNQAATADTAPYQQILGRMSEDMNDIDPQLRHANQEYGRVMEGEREANDILFNQDVPRIRPTASQERQAASRIGRMGDDTQAGTGASERQMDALRADPERAEILRPVEYKKAIERTRPAVGSPMSVSPGKWGVASLTHNAMAAAPLLDEGLQLGAQASRGLASSTLPSIALRTLDAEDRKRAERARAEMQQLRAEVDAILSDSQTDPISEAARKDKQRREKQKTNIVGGSAP